MAITTLDGGRRWSGGLPARGPSALVSQPVPVPLDRRESVGDVPLASAVLRVDTYRRAPAVVPLSSHREVRTARAGQDRLHRRWPVHQLARVNTGLKSRHRPPCSVRTTARLPVPTLRSRCRRSMPCQSHTSRPTGRAQNEGSAPDRWSSSHRLASLNYHYGPSVHQERGSSKDRPPSASCSLSLVGPEGRYGRVAL